VAHGHVTVAAPDAKTKNTITVNFKSAMSVSSRFMLVDAGRRCNSKRQEETQTIESTQMFASLQGIQTSASVITTNSLTDATTATTHTLSVQATRQVDHGKGRLCLCAGGTTATSGEGLVSGQTCETTSATSYGAQAAWLHIVDMATVGRSFTIAKATSQTVKVTFSNNGDAADRGILVDGYTGNCGVSKVPTTTVVWGSIHATAPNTGSSVVYEFKNGNNAAPISAGKQKLCFCDQSATPGANDIELADTGTGSADCSDPLKYWRFGAELGTVHVVDATTVGRHYTVGKSSSQSVSVSFLTGMTPSDGLNDRLMLVHYDNNDDLMKHCGSAPESTELASTMKSKAPTTGITLSDLKVSGITGTLAGKAKLCYCDFNMEGPTHKTPPSQGCKDDAQFGADLGILHVVDLDAVPMHSTVLIGGPAGVTTAIPTQQSITVTFSNSITSFDGRDRMRMVGKNSECTDTTEDTTLVDSIWSDVPATTFSLRTLTISKVIKQSIGKAKLCFCDASVEYPSVINCKGVASTDEKNYGAQLGFLHSVGESGVCVPYLVDKLDFYPSIVLCGQK
jgi:23S rRNA pseudoU1915 N3-methylase RlmH